MTDEGRGFLSKLSRLALTPTGLCVFLTVAVIAVYAQVYAFDYAYYDDAQYVFQNPNVVTGLTAKNVAWSFSAGYAANWHPVTWMSHMLDVTIFGIDPSGHHVVNLLFHLANTLLLFVLMRRMTGDLFIATAVSFLFAVHPLRAESVAWIAERKDVLFMFFGLLAMLAYLRFVESRRVVDYLAVFLCLALSLMSKPMLVTLPILLLLLDYWPLRRVSLDLAGLRAHVPRLLLEKVPLLLLSAGSSMMTVIAQDRGGAIQSLNVLPLDVRVTNSIVAYVKYIGMLFWPTGLAFDYPHPLRSTSGGTIALCLLILVVVTIAFWRVRERSPYLLVGWAWYLVTMIPVIGLVQVGYQGLADRYTYFTQIGLCIVIAYACQRVYASRAIHRGIFVGGGVALALLLMVLTYRQVGTWRNLETLMDHALLVTDRNAKAHFGKGLALHFRGEHEAALREFDEALAIAPNYVEVHQQIAIVRERMRQQQMLVD